MPSRREFGRAIATAAAGLTAAQLEASKIIFSGATQDSSVKADSGEIEARYANALRAYGDRLSDSQRQQLRKILEQNERMLVNVRGFSVQNGDPPAITLRLEPTR